MCNAVPFVEKPKLKTVFKNIINILNSYLYLFIHKLLLEITFTIPQGVK